MHSGSQTEAFVFFSTHAELPSRVSLQCEWPLPVTVTVQRRPGTVLQSAFSFNLPDRTQQVGARPAKFLVRTEKTKN